MLKTTLYHKTCEMRNAYLEIKYYRASTSEWQYTYTCMYSSPWNPAKIQQQQNKILIHKDKDMIEKTIVGKYFNKHFWSKKAGGNWLIRAEYIPTSPAEDSVIKKLVIMHHGTPPRDTRFFQRLRWATELKGTALVGKHTHVCIHQVSSPSRPPWKIL